VIWKQASPARRDLGVSLALHLAEMLKTNDRSGKSHVIHSTGNVFENLNDETFTAAFPWENSQRDLFRSAVKEHDIYLYRT